MPLIRTDVGNKPRIDEQQRLARYQALFKVENLLRDGTLRLGSLASYVEMDPLEGALPSWCYNHRLIDNFEQLPPALQKQLRNIEVSSARRSLGDSYRLTIFKQNREERIAQIRAIMSHTYISSWSVADSESWMMWTSYAEEGAAVGEEKRGVSLVTTPARIRSALSKTEGDFHLGRVRYLNNREEASQNTFDVATSKRFEYRHEEEIRLLLTADDGFQVIMHVPFPDPETVPNADNIISSSPTQPPMIVDVDTEALIEEMIIHPGASREDESAIINMVSYYGLKIPVRKSTLLSPVKVPPAI